MVRREILAVFEGKQKGTKSPKPIRLRPSKFICMHFTSTSTCMSFLSQFYFLTPWTIVPWSERKICWQGHRVDALVTSMRHLKID